MKWFRRTKKAAKSGQVANCGHETSAEGQISAHGETTTMAMPRNEAGGFDYCLDCVAAMTIRCAWCGSVIFIGSPVTLYSPKENLAVPDHAVVYSENPLRLVGCLGWDCADTGADRAGFWMPGDDGLGQVHRVPTAFELMVGDSSISSVMVSDLSDVRQEPVIIRNKSD